MARRGGSAVRKKIVARRPLRIVSGGQCRRQALYLDVFDISKLGLPPHQSLTDGNN